MLLLESSRWFGPYGGYVEPVIGTYHRSATATMAEFAQFSDSPITITCQPTMGWAEPYICELRQGVDEAAYLVHEKDMPALIAAGATITEIDL